MTKKTILYGRSNYEELVNKNSYFVDKTGYIRLLEDYDNPIFLRPRRFGKSLWCSILNNYYDINKKDRFETLFANTDIGNDPTPNRNTHLVLHLNFSVINVTDDITNIETSFKVHANGALRLISRTYSPAILGEQNLSTKLPC